MNNTNTSSREIRGIAIINKISMIEKEKIGESREPCETPCLNRKERKEKPGKYGLVILSERKVDNFSTNHLGIHHSLRL
jgi:hypothetical protein